MELIEKEVYFHQYCQTCKHRDKSEGEDPCWDCLDQPWNEHSHKPINWKSAKGFEGWVAPEPQPKPEPEPEEPKNYFDPTGEHGNEQLIYSYDEPNGISRFETNLGGLKQASTSIIIRIPAAEAAGKTIRVSADSTVMSTATQHVIILTGMTSSDTGTRLADLDTWGNPTFAISKLSAMTFAEHGYAISLGLRCTRSGANLPLGSYVQFKNLKVTLEETEGDEDADA